MEDNAARNPDKKLEIKLTLEDIDLVATYSMCNKTRKISEQL